MLTVLISTNTLMPLMIFISLTYTFVKHATSRYNSLVFDPKFGNPLGRFCNKLVKQMKIKSNNLADLSECFFFWKYNAVWPNLPPKYTRSSYHKNITFLLPLILQIFPWENVYSTFCLSRICYEYTCLIIVIIIKVTAEDKVNVLCCLTSTLFETFHQ